MTLIPRRSRRSSGMWRKASKSEKRGMMVLVMVVVTGLVLHAYDGLMEGADPDKAWCDVW